MRKTLVQLTMLTALILTSSAHAKELVTTFSGSDNVTTGSFEVEGPWVLDWWVSTDFPSGFLIEIHLVDASTGYQHARVLRTRRAGNGVKLFQEGGRFKFRISSSLARWNLRVEEITKEEVALYRPIEREKRDDGIVDKNNR
jgi:hypothetical protein